MISLAKLRLKPSRTAQHRGDKLPAYCNRIAAKGLIEKYWDSRTGATLASANEVSTCGSQRGTNGELLLNSLELVVMRLQELLSDDGEQVILADKIRYVRESFVSRRLDGPTEVANGGERLPEA